MRFLIVGSLLSLLLASCSHSGKISGTVYRITGNQMPSPDVPAPVYPGMQTRIYFFELTAIKDTKGGDGSGMYQQIDKPLVAAVTSDVQGRFRIRLRPGRYSVLIGNNDLFYTNRSDTAGYLNPIDVVAGTRQKLELRADWGANY